MPDQNILEMIKKGIAIPPLPLALSKRKKIDEKYQRALIRYYFDAGAGGVAVGVHTTQFEIRNPGINLFQPLLEFARDVVNDCVSKNPRPFVKIAGVCGKSIQAKKEAETASSLGYDAALLSLAALKNASDAALIDHCKTISRIIPIFGFYLQPAVGGRILPYSFWRRFVEIENVVAVKIAPFNRYQTLDVVRAVAMSGRDNDVTLYTGNDDNIIMDLITPCLINTTGGVKTIRIKGGLLGQWSVWTRKAVSLLEQIHGIMFKDNPIPPALLAKSASLTDANAVLFDAANNFKGCIPGIHEILRRQGLLQTIRCLDPNLKLSPGQKNEIDRISRDYPFLSDDDFVRDHLEEWLR
ncbi:dihydrodipicolinate synthase family protein [Candidatus Sumerlaeota bacterium]|nr:dihydrodipicolinate synthase family protein [Candidatus Sumerlaeota bacterium]